MLSLKIQRFIEVFSKLPSIGPRQAHRLAFYLVNLSKEDFKKLELALTDLKNIDRCPRCFFIKSKDQKMCSFCEDPARDNGIVAIIEKETDLISLEKVGVFKGQYLVIGESSGRGALTSSQKLRLKSLKERIQKDKGGRIKEIILALGPTAEGDFLADLIKRGFKDNALKITRLGRGLPTGADIEFADEETLISAFERRN